MKSITKGGDIIKEIKRLKSEQWWNGDDPPKTYALTSNGIFQQPLLVLLSEIIPPNHLIKLKILNVYIS